LSDAQDLSLSVLLEHWEARLLSTARLVSWVRAASDHPRLFAGLADLARLLERRYTDNEALVKWARLVGELVSLRVKRQRDNKEHDDNEYHTDNDN
jgi:hypothetical protein